MRESDKKAYQSLVENITRTGTDIGLVKEALKNQ